ncbi:hypothetical protein ACFE04_021088 [Oxalis oulophora]
MDNFREVLEVCGLKEIQSMGPWFTWKNNRRGGNEIFEKLDRVLANDKWDAMFPDAGVSVLTASISDHLPLMLNTQKLTGWHAGVKGFKFENFWTGSLECFEIVKQCWNSNQSWNENVFGAQNKLAKWSKEEFGSIHSRIRRNQRVLQDLLNDHDPRILSAPDFGDASSLSAFAALAKAS